ncbi:DUF4288 domain-containing protein [Myxococcus sp. RHSTA-1-4]|uniref:DUF4288 domain-containing protein n=1 Tax=Myxococcus sp. RHSTA-1-4 TaxID=2874601 RepID=UPI001CBA93E2|nr:DUF4288 domain-containing protein [Myxococcus sp. RHSTA-1-4]MBZ4419651.1 DUF4288 domain-containing protein [Myxococcus sp. RHSTA-1-4]
MGRPEKVWFAASVIMYFRLKSGRQRTFPIQENVFLIFARDFDEARIRAEELGRAEESQEGTRWNGKPVEVVFGGVRKVVSCAADPAVPGSSDVTKLYDGVEATYSSFLVKSRAELDALIQGKPATVVYEE